MNKLAIDTVNGYTKQVGYIVSMMNIVRESTYFIIKNLNENLLYKQVQSSSNSIATLLFHIAYIEHTTILTLKGEAMTEDEISFWKPGMPNFMNKNMLNGYNKDFYIETLSKIRCNTLDYLKVIDDEWLLNEFKNNNFSGNNYFRLFHIVEDEISHTGQILMLKNLVH